MPPGTSKWNKIEHQLFSHISMNWRGRCHRAGDSGPVDAEQQSQYRVRQVVSQVDRRGHQPVDEHQLVSAPAPAARFLASPRAA